MSTTHQCHQQGVRQRSITVDVTVKAAAGSETANTLDRNLVSVAVADVRMHGV
jgi:hypothetical protein